MSLLNDVLGAVYRKEWSVLRRLNSEAVNVRDDDGRTPLMHAVLAEDADPDVIAALARQGADLDARDNEQRWTALHFAARDHNVLIVRALLELGATVDSVDAFGNTPLWRAVGEFPPSAATVMTLLRYGADPHKKNQHGIAPIDVARDEGRTELLALLSSPPSPSRS